MRIINLDMIKANARIEENIEDNQLKEIGDVAEQSVLNLIERSYEDVIDEFGYVPSPIVHSCLMMATHLYENRSLISSSASNPVPYTIDALLKPYIRF